MSKDFFKHMFNFLFVKWNLALYVVLFVAGSHCLQIQKEMIELDPDAQNYKVFAESMQHPYDTQFREPVWIWLVKTSLIVFKEGDNSLRYLGILLFLLTCVALYHLSSRIFHSRWWGICGAALYAFNPYLENLAARGLRDNAFNLFLVLMSLYLYSGKSPLNLRRFLIGITVVTCCLVGVRINTWVPLLVLIPMSFWQMRIPLKFSVIPLIASLLLITPYLFYCKDKYNDALYSSNMHAKWWRNFEFVKQKKTGCEGCPTEEQMKTEGTYSGEPITTFQYVFKLRTVQSLIEDTSLGYAYILVPPIKFIFSIFGNKRNGAVFERLLHVPKFPAEYFYFIGLLMVFSSGFLSVFLLPLLILNFMPFTYFLGMDERIFSLVSPYMVLLSVYGLVLTVRWLSKLPRVET